MLKKIIRFPLQFVIFLLFLSTFLVGVAQFQFVKDKIRDILITKLNESINGEILIGRIRGNLIFYIEIDGIILKNNSEIILSADNATIRLNPFLLLNNQVSISEFILTKPRINIAQNKDGTWNFENILKPKPKSEKSSDTFLNLSGIQIKDGLIKFNTNGEIDKQEDQKHFDFSSNILSEFNLSSQFKIDSIDKYLNVEHLSFIDKNNKELKDFSGRFYLLEKEIKIDTLNLEFGKSRINLNVALRNFNFTRDTLSLSCLRYKPVELNLNAQKIFYEDLKYFISDVDFLYGATGLKLSADGNFNDLKIKNLLVENENSRFNISGNVLNLYQPDRLYLKINISNSFINSKDINRYLYGLSLPDFGELGSFTFNIEYDGEPNDFRSKIGIFSSNGNIEGTIAFNLKEKLPEYNVDLKTNNFNLEPVLGKKYYSRFNAGIKGNGRGFKIENIVSDFTINIDSSVFINQAIQVAQIAITMINKHIDAKIGLRNNLTRLGLNANIDYSKNNEEYYNINLSLVNFNPTKLTLKPDDSSNVNLFASIDGKSFNPESATGNASIILHPSKFASYKIDSLNSRIFYNQDNPARKVFKINSNIADLEVTGKFRTSSIIDNIIKAFSSLSDNVVKTFPFPSTPYNVNDTSIIFHPRVVESTIDAFDEASDSVNFRYYFRCKNLKPVLSFMKNYNLNSDLTFDGNLSGSDDKFKLRGKFNIEGGYLNSKNTHVLLYDAKCDYNLSINNNLPLFINSENRIQLFIDSIYFNNNKISKTKLLLTSSKNTGHFEFETKMDSIRLKMISNLSFSDTLHTFLIDTLNFIYKNYAWKNSSRSTIKLRKDECYFDKFEIFHQQEKVGISGGLNINGSQDLKIKIQNLEIRNISSLFSTDEKNPMIDGKLNFDCYLGGNSDNPIIDISLTSDSVYFDNNYLGTISGNTNYKDKTVFTDIKLWNNEKNKSLKPDMNLIGTMPLNLRLNDYDSIIVKDREMDLYFIASDFTIPFSRRIFQELEYINGKADFNMHLMGNFSQPNISGFININNTSLIVKYNRIEYNLNGKIKFQDTLIFTDLNLKNRNEDNKQGSININGLMVFKNFMMQSVNLNVNGQLLVLKEESRKSSKNVYGNLIISFDKNKNLKYTYNRENGINLLSGIILIKEANLKFPPASSSTSTDNGSDNFIFNFTEEKPAIQSVNILSKKEKFRLESHYDLASFEDQKVNNTFLDKIDLNLEIKTVNNLKINMIFNPLLNEELVGEIEGNISIIKNRKSNNVYGNLNISDKSYYKFAGKKFDATGKIIFAGSLSNPELDIKATYQGIHINREQQNKEEDVLITLYIKGTKDKPTLKFELAVDSKLREQTDVESDVFAFILTGYFNNELTSDQKQNIALNYKFQSSFYSIGSSVLSGRLTEFFKNEFEFIRSVEAEYQGDLTRTNLMISGEIGKAAIFHFGGKVFNDLGNTNISLELPIGKILNNDILSNMILEIYRNTSEKVKTTENKEIPYYGTRLFYRINF